MPALTATSEAFLFQPVAKALDCSAGKMPTSGMPILALVASSRTVSTSQRSSGVRGLSITCTRVLIFAIHLERNKDTSAPLKPNTAQKASSELKSSPSEVRKRPTPNKLSVTPATASTARLVSRNRPTRNTVTSPVENKKFWLRAKWVRCASNSTER